MSKRRIRFVLDASTLYPIALNVNKYIDILSESVILDLTVYEVCNAGLVAWRRGLLRNYMEFLRALSEIVSTLTLVKIAPEDIVGIGEIAEKTGLTFYDAAYVYVAKKLNLKLITEDRKILEKAGNQAITLSAVKQ